jgi:hypothetical protein
MPGVGGGLGFGGAAGADATEVALEVGQGGRVRRLPAGSLDIEIKVSAAARGRHKQAAMAKSQVNSLPRGAGRRRLPPARHGQGQERRPIAMRAGNFLSGALKRKLDVAAAVLAGAFGEAFWLRHGILTTGIMPKFNYAFSTGNSSFIILQAEGRSTPFAPRCAQKSFPRTWPDGSRSCPRWLENAPTPRSGRGWP